jgi:hypothetical protein
VWDWAIWGALAAGFLAATGGLAFLVVRTLQAWRDFKRVRRHVFKGLDDLAAKGELTAEKAAAAAETEELERSVARLRGSLARFAVLRAALDEAQETFARPFAFLPRK